MAQLFVKTPLIRSAKLSDRVGANVWLKMESAQLSGSFKARGLSKFAQKAVDERKCKKFASFSGGNAGLAAAYAAQKLGVPITVVIPEATPSFIAERLKMENAEVEIKSTFDEARERAEQLAQEPGCELIHPFDHPDIWEGHASIVEEIHEQLQGPTPDLVVLSVGGGGLMNGVLEGMHRVGWTSVPLLAIETEGANSLNACTKAGEWVELEEITSIAVCLAVKRVCKRSYEWLSQHPVLTETVTDKEAVSACIQMADDHRVLVPPACGAALAGLYTPSVLERVAPKLQCSLQNVVVIVCGGSGVNLDLIQKWKKNYNL